MSRSKDQIIPPLMMPAWTRALGRPVLQTANTYPKPDWTWVQRKHYPHHLEPPHVPTGPQLSIRDALRRMDTFYHNAPYSERFAYWQLAGGTGFSGTGLYAHRHLSDIYHGATEAQIKRPRAFTRENWGYLVPNWVDLIIGAGHPGPLICEFELDQVTPDPQPFWPPGTQYGVYYQRITGPLIPPPILLGTWNPTVRERFTASLPLVTDGLNNYAVTFRAVTNDITPKAVLWKFELDPRTEDAYPFHWTGPSP